MAPLPPRRFALVVVAAPLLVALAATLALVVTDTDLSASPELRNDLVFRASAATRSVKGGIYRHDDPSGHVQFLPAAVAMHRALRSGELPHWEPHAGGGSSPIRRFQLAVFHPLRLAAVLVPERQAQSFTNLCAIAFALAGMVLLLVQLSVPRGGAVVAAGAFAFSSHSCMTMVVDFPLVVAHLPWLALALLTALRARGPSPLDRGSVALSAVGASALVSLLIMSGHPGVAVPICAVAVGVALSAALSSQRAGLTALRVMMARLILIGALGVCGAAIALVPFAHELSSAWTYKYETNFGALYAPFSWRYWPSMVALLVTSDEPGTYGDRFNAYAWLGPGIVVLALVGAASTLRRKSLWPAALLLLTFAFCVPGPWMEWGRFVPGLWTIKVWYLYPCLPFAVAVCAAYGWDSLSTRVPMLGRPVIVAAAAVFIWTTAPLRAALWITPQSGPLLPKSAVLDAVKEGARQLPVRVNAPAGQTHAPNLAAISGVDDLRTHGATLSRRYHRWFEIVDPIVTSRTFPSTRATPIVDHPLLTSFGVGFILEPRVAGDDWHIDPNAAPDEVRRIESIRPGASHDTSSLGLELVLDDGFVRLWRQPAARPRVDRARQLRLVSDVDAADAELRSLHERGQLDRHDVVEVAGASRAALERLATTGSAAHAVRVLSFLRPSPARLRLELDVRVDALVVVQELFEEGWRARVDGHDTDVLPVNLIARGVVVPAGRHVVELRYRTPGFVAGAMLSAFAVALAVALLVFTRPRRAL